MRSARVASNAIEPPTVLAEGLFELAREGDDGHVNSLVVDAAGNVLALWEMPGRVVFAARYSVLSNAWGTRVPMGTSVQGADDAIGLSLSASGDAAAGWVGVNGSDRVMRVRRFD